MSRLALVVGSLLLLAGCGPKELPPASAAGECKLVEAPKYAVLGQRPEDQRWINRTTEAIVVGCNQPRPLPRPPGWSTHTVGGKTVPIPPPVKPEPKKTFLDRLRGTVR